MDIRKWPGRAAAFCTLTAIAVCATTAADATPITTQAFPDNFGGPVTCLGTGNDAASLTRNAGDCTSAGGFVMMPFGDDPHAPGSVVDSVASPLGGTVHFLEQDGVNPVTDALPMIVGNPAWWQYNDHSSSYLTDVSWIELHFDTTGANAVRAFSLFVGASFNGVGWVQSFDQFGNESLERFTVNPGNSPGFGVYGAPGSCSTISRIIVEPRQLWGVGNFAVNQDPCVQVPEPGSLGLLSLGFLAFGFARRVRRS